MLVLGGEEHHRGLGVVCWMSAVEAKCVVRLATGLVMRNWKVWV